jgi:hypothetical protein
MSEQEEMDEQKRLQTRAMQIKTGLVLGVPVGVADLIFQGGPAGIVFGGAGVAMLAYYAPDIKDQAIHAARVAKEIFPFLPVPKTKGHGRTLYQRAMGIYPEIDESKVVDADQPEDTSVLSESDPLQPSLSEEDALFTLPSSDDTGGVRRFTVDEIVKHIQPNSYRIFVGRSMTKNGNPAVAINIYKQHFRFIGASQRGKSSMVAAFIDIVTRTHDREHVLLCLLDKEDQTSKLFAHLPHVMKIQYGNEPVRMYARKDDEVLERLIDLVRIMNKRYEMKKSEIINQPIILVYVEEFLSLKNTFKSRMEKAKAKKDEDLKAKSISDHQTLVYCIEELCQRGLKVRIQLLLCAQIEYADDDFKEAMVSVGCGFSFCVRPKAAESAGFRNYPLLKKNAEDNKVGQAVVECPDCNDLVLAPDYPLEERLIELEKAELASSSPSEVVTDQLQNDPQLIAQLRALSYSEYLKTDHWQQQRRSALQRAQYRCQVCNASNTQLDTHHRTYERLGCELPEDLFVLCHECHSLFSQNGKLARPDVHQSAFDASNIRYLHSLSDGRVAQRSPTGFVEHRGDSFSSRLGESPNSRPEHTTESGRKNTGELENPVGGPLKPLGESPNSCSSYPLMNDEQIGKFRTLYPYMGTEKALDEIPGCSHKHREHAREIIKQYDLKRAERKSRTK